MSLDRLANWTVRTWTPAAPALAGGPLDPAIPEVSLESPAVLALGICAPAAIRTDLAMTGMRTWVGAAWQRDGAQLRPLALETIGRTLDDRALAVLYRPVDSGELLGSWPSGHFVLELGLHDGANASGGAEASGPPLEPAARFIALSVPGPG